MFDMYDQSGDPQALLEALQALQGSRANMRFTGMQPPRMVTGFEGIPGMDNPFVAMIGGPIIQKLMGSYGYTPGGFNNHDVYGLMRYKQFIDQQNAMLRLSAAADRPRVMDTMRGLAAMTGTPWGADQMRAARGISDMIESATPMLAMAFPEQMDALYGMRGSAAVMGMQMQMANRYRIDPVTGLMGQSPETSQALVDQFANNLFSGDLRQARGMTMGRAGQLYGELSMRGMLPASMGPRETLQQMMVEGSSADAMMLTGKAIAARGGIAGIASGLLKGQSPLDMSSMTPEQFNKMLEDPQVAERMRSFNASKVQQTLKSYIDAINAVRDIFTSEGRGNATMPELLAALDSLTGDAVGQVSGERLKTMVRSSQQLAEDAGLSMSQLSVLQGHTQTMAQAQGLNPIFGVHAAQASMGWLINYRNQGGALTPAFGAYNETQSAQAHANLSVNAMNSQVAQRIGAALTLERQVGGFAKGSEAEAYVAALRRSAITGETTYTFNGKERELGLENDDAFYEVFESSKTRNNRTLDRSRLRGALSDRRANEEAVNTAGLHHLPRMMQGAIDARKWWAASTEAGLSDALGTVATGNRAAAEKAFTALSSRMANFIQSMNPNTFRDAEAREAAIEQFVRGELGGTAEGRELLASGFDVKQLGQRVVAAASTAIQDPKNMMAPYDNIYNVQEQFNPGRLQQSFTAELRSRMEGRIRDAVSPLNQSSAGQRFFQFIQTSDPSKMNIPTALATTLGISSDELKAFETPITELRTAYQDAMKQMTAASQITDPDKRRAAMQAVQTQIELVNSRAAALQTQIAAIRPAGGGMINADVLEETKGLAKTQADSRATVRQRMETQQFATQAEKEKYLRTDEGREVIQRERWLQKRTEDIATQLSASPDALRAYGAAGLRQGQLIEDYNSELQLLADKYTDGDISKLQLGVFTAKTPAERAAVLAEVSNLTIKRQTVISGLSSRKKGDKVDALELIGLISSLAPFVGDKDKARLLSISADSAQKFYDADNGLLGQLGGMGQVDDAAVTALNTQYKQNWTKEQYTDVQLMQRANAERAKQNEDRLMPGATGLANRVIAHLGLTVDDKTKADLVTNLSDPTRARVVSAGLRAVDANKGLVQVAAAQMFSSFAQGSFGAMLSLDAIEGADKEMLEQRAAAISRAGLGLNVKTLDAFLNTGVSQQKEEAGKPQEVSLKADNVNINITGGNLTVTNNGETASVAVEGQGNLDTVPTSGIPTAPALA